MAEDEKAAQKEAQTPPPEERKARAGRRGRKVEPPVSLYPLTFEEAVAGLLEVKLEKDKPDKDEG
jgi:hypothetical protein